MMPCIGVKFTTSKLHYRTTTLTGNARNIVFPLNKFTVTLILSSNVV